MVVHAEFDRNSYVWAHAKPQLERLIRRYPEYFPYGLEDVENALAIGNYSIIEFSDAFAIVEEDRGYLHAVVAAGYSGEIPDLAYYSEMLYELAISSGFEGFKFTTPRKGWQKRALEAGFKELASEVTYIYEKQENTG